MAGQQLERNLLLKRGIVDSLCGDREPLLVGFLNGIVGTVVCFISSGDPFFLVFAVGFFVTCIPRLMLWRAYRDITPENIDAAALDLWQGRFIAGGVSTAIVLGLWGFYSLTYSTDHLSHLVSSVFGVGNMVGIAGRNFGSRKYVIMQSVAIVGPVTFGLMLNPDPTFWILIPLYFSFVLAVIVISESLYEVLKNALRREADVSRIADELSLALDTMPNGLMMFDDHNLLKVCDADAAIMLGMDTKPQNSVFSVDDLVGQISSTFNPNAGDLAQIRFDLSGNRQPGRSSEFILRDGNGRSYRFLSASDDKLNLVVRIDDITLQQNAENRIKAMARYDALTGLSNRAWFFQQIEGLMDSPVRQMPVVVAVMDLDDFKNVNDTYGHPVGDAMLVSAADRVTALLGERDICARFGGDEFVLMLEQQDVSVEAVEARCAEIADAVNGTLAVSGLKLQLKASIGASAASKLSVGINRLIAQADYALYTAKHTDTLETCVFQDDMQETMQRQKRLRNDLKEAVRNQSLQTMYQPIVDETAKRVVDVEALCRWTHPELGVIGPDEFIPIAEDTGLISEITKQQLYSACHLCMTLPQETGVSVNLSAIDFRSRQLLHSIRGALQASGLDPARLTVEVTETSLLDLKPETIRIVDDIRAIGVKVALDDFGVGYSSLSYLHKLPLDRLKIDRSFAMEVGESEKTRKLMHTLARLAQDIDLEMVVEGIETQDQMTIIREVVSGGRYQGYLFSPPLPKNAIAEYAFRLMPGSQLAPSGDTQEAEMNGIAV